MSESIYDRWGKDVGFGTPGTLPPANEKDLAVVVVGEKTALVTVLKDLWRESQHPRDRHGRFASKPGGGPTPTLLAPWETLRNRLGLPVDVGGDVDRAARLISEGKAVRLDQPSTASTLIDKLAEIAHEAEAKGQDAPDFDLCKVSVKHTNLFCSNNKGVPRVRMPQLAGKPIPGSKADKLKKDAKGEVDLTPEFEEYIRERGHRVLEGKILAKNLRASQRQLSGKKVAALLKYRRRGGKTPGTIWVSRDDYIIDGHHRWATDVALAAEQGKLDGTEENVLKADLPINIILAFAKQFTREWGMPSDDIEGTPHVEKPNIPDVAPRNRMEAAVDEELRKAEKRAGLPEGSGDGFERLLAYLRIMLEHRKEYFEHTYEAGPAGNLDFLKRIDELNGAQANVPVDQPKGMKALLAWMQDHDADMLDLMNDLTHIIGFPLGAHAIEPERKKYNPDQPRDPGGEHGGQWIGGGPSAELFVTPARSERENAASYYATPRWKQFEADVHRQANDLGVTVRSEDLTQGIWSKTPEPSATFHLKGRETDRLAARVGRKWDQDAVLTFHPGDDGPDTEYHLLGAGKGNDAPTVLAAAEKHGLFGATRNGDDIVVVAGPSMGGESEADILNFGSDLGATGVDSYSGTARLIAREEYDSLDPEDQSKASEGPPGSRRGLDDTHRQAAEAQAQAAAPTEALKDWRTQPRDPGGEGGGQWVRSPGGAEAEPLPSSPLAAFAPDPKDVEERMREQPGRSFPDALPEGVKGGEQGENSSMTDEDDREAAKAVTDAVKKFPEITHPPKTGWHGRPTKRLDRLSFMSKPSSRDGVSVAMALGQMYYTKGQVTGAATGPDEDRDPVTLAINDNPDIGDGIHGMLEGDARSSVAPGTRSVYGEVMHELGHALAWATGLQTLQSMDKGEQPEIYEGLIKKHKLSSVAAGTSEYAAESPMEAFAEMFSDYMTNNMDSEARANFAALLSEITGRQT